MSTIRITVDFWRPRFHGLRERGEPEWPPSPLRLAQAILSASHRPNFDAGARMAIESLTELPNPMITTPRVTTVALPSTYTHRTGGVNGSANGGDLKYILDLAVAGMSAVNLTAKPQGRVDLDDCEIVYDVDDPDESVDVEALDRAARRVPYLGRSQDGCDISVARVDTAAETSAGYLTLEPRYSSAGTTRGWAPNSCEWMDINHQLMVDGWVRPPLAAESFMTRLSYRSAHTSDSETAQVQCIGLGRSMPGGRSRKLMQDASKLLEELPVQAFPCVDAGYRFADGKFRGIGLIAGSADEEDLAEAVRRMHALNELSFDNPDLVSQALRPSFWTKASTSWASATPLRAFPDERVVDHFVRSELARVTGQTPLALAFSKEPSRRWQRRWSQPPDGLGLWWLEATFESRVQGPIVVGETKDQGFGLLVAVPETT